MGLFKLFLYFLLFYAIYSIIRFAFRVNKARKHFENTFQTNQDIPQKKKGETLITYVPDKEKKDEVKTGSSGEYIEYEDLK